MGNSNEMAGRSSYASREKRMAAYDALPRSVREALANAAFDWAAYPIHKWFQAGRRTAKELVKDIAAWDRNEITRHAKKVSRSRRAV